MKKVFLFLLFLATQLLVAQGETPLAKPCKSDRFLREPLFGNWQQSDILKRAYKNTLTEEDVENDRAAAIELSLFIFTHGAETLQTERQQFNLRAFLNFWDRKKPVDENDYDFGMANNLARYTEHCTVAFASCFTESDCLDRNDLRRLAKIALKGLWLYEKTGNVSVIDRFVTQLRFNVRASSVKNRQVITAFTEMLLELNTGK